MGVLSFIYGYLEYNNALYSYTLVVCRLHDLELGSVQNHVVKEFTLHIPKFPHHSL